MNKFLKRKIELFRKLADGISLKVDVIKLHDPILKKLMSIKSYKDRMEFLKDSFELLGEGSSRAVYALSETLIIKLATNIKGLAQNLEESRICAQRNCTAKVILADHEGKWNINNRIEKIDKVDFEKLTGIDFDDFTSSIYYQLNAEGDYKKPNRYNEVSMNPFFKDVVGLILDANLQIGDLRKLSSWGELNGKAVLSDFGLSRDVWSSLYEN